MVFELVHKGNVKLNNLTVLCNSVAIFLLVILSLLKSIVVNSESKIIIVFIFKDNISPPQIVIFLGDFPATLVSESEITLR